MANDPQSARRRNRDTLMGLPSAAYNSAIPQPSSALKKSISMNLQAHSSAPFSGATSHQRSLSSSRQSLAPNAFGRTPASNGNGQEFLQRVNSAGASAAQHRQSAMNSRQSMMPGGMSLMRSQQTPAVTAQNQRRSSSYSRPPSMGQSLMTPAAHHTPNNPSSGGLLSRSFYPCAPLPAGVPKDPRPLRDRSYQQRLGQELMEFLTANNFEMEMKHSLTQNSMKSPTQKDFNFVFQWLYKRIDPSYRFMKAIDAEVPPILKSLRYPFAGQITKSQIAAVGGQNWSTFLGLLHWMMQLGIMMDRFASGEYDHLSLEAGFDPTAEKIVFGYLSGAYNDWIMVDQESDPEQALEPHRLAMAAAFEEGNAKLVEELKIMEGENKALNAQIAELERAMPDVEKLDRHFGILSDDREKFEVYNKSIEQKAEKYEQRIKFLNEEVSRTESELAEADRERRELQMRVDEQGISVADIDRMNSERERLIKGGETASQRLEESKGRLTDREADAHRRLEDLERAVERYSSLGYSVGILPSNAPNAQGRDLGLSLVMNGQSPDQAPINFSTSTSATSTESRLLQQPAGTAHNPGSLLNVLPKSEIRPHLTALQHQLVQRRQGALDDMLKDTDTLETLKESLDEKKAEVEAIGHRVRAAEEEFEKTKEVENNASMRSRAEIERMEKELGRMRVSAGEGWRVMENREAVVNVEYEQLVLRAESVREELHTEVEKMLNDVIKFKVHIQKSLEDYEAFVVEEVEDELGREIEKTMDLDITGVHDRMRDMEIDQ